MEDAIVITATPVESTPQSASEEMPSWASQLRSEMSESNSLLRESLEISRQQNQMLPEVMRTNAELTSQLQAMPGQVIELVRPLLTPPVLEVKPPTDTLPPDDESEPLVVVETPPEPEVTPAARRKLRGI